MSKSNNCEVTAKSATLVQMEHSETNEVFVLGFEHNTNELTFEHVTILEGFSQCETSDICRGLSEAFLEMANQIDNLEEATNDNT